MLNRLTLPFVTAVSIATGGSAMAQDETVYDGLPTYETASSSYKVTQECIFQSIENTLEGVVYHLDHYGDNISGMNTRGVITVYFDELAFADTVEVTSIEVIGGAEGNNNALARIEYLEGNTALIETTTDWTAHHMAKEVENRMRACLGPQLLG